MTGHRIPGLDLAKGIAATAIAGAVLLVALDFGRADDAAGAPSSAEPSSIERRLKSISNIDLFTSVDAPGTDLKVSTGAEYADAHALADGKVAFRWCYVERPRHGSAVQPHIELGRQDGDAPPVLASVALAPEQARLLGIKPAAVAELARHCRFGR